jgi:hypothetical protein
VFLKPYLSEDIVFLGEEIAGALTNSSPVSFWFWARLQACVPLLQKCFKFCLGKWYGLHWGSKDLMYAHTTKFNLNITRFVVNIRVDSHHFALGSHFRTMQRQHLRMIEVLFMFLSITVKAVI